MYTHSIYDEPSLLQRLEDGDERAFEAIYDLHRANIYTTALRLTRSSVIAEEIVQDVFMKLWKGRKTARGIVSLKAYLQGIAGHVIYDALEKKYKEKEQSFVKSILFHNDTENTIIDKDYQTILNNAIEQLPGKQRQTYLLIRHRGFKREEVARELNVSPETVKWNLEQATRRIKAYCNSKIDISLCILLISAIVS